MLWWSQLNRSVAQMLLEIPTVSYPSNSSIYGLIQTPVDLLRFFLPADEAWHARVSLTKIDQNCFLVGIDFWYQRGYSISVLGVSRGATFFDTINYYNIIFAILRNWRPWPTHSSISKSKTGYVRWQRGSWLAFLRYLFQSISPFSNRDIELVEETAHLRCPHIELNPDLWLSFSHMSICSCSLLTTLYFSSWSPPGCLSWEKSKKPNFLRAGRNFLHVSWG